MPRVTITCDRKDGLCRAAVWREKTLVDLYIDRLERPDMTGAVVRGKIVRVLAGHKTAWVECGLKSKLFLQSKTDLKNGEIVTLKIKSTTGHGKAWAGVPVKAEEGDEIGLLAPPPLPWQRALDGLPKETKAVLLFESAEDYKAFQLGQFGTAQASLSLKDPAHPDLEGTLDALLDPVVALQGGATIVIEPTEAFVAIDVNGGENANPLAVNLVAVREAIRQIRLRNLSGIIVIDCLKMKERADISKLINAATRVADEDPAGVHVFGLTKLGLLEMTRTRCSAPLHIVLAGR